MLLTHPHADHTHGIDDLRPLYRERTCASTSTWTSRPRSGPGRLFLCFETPERSSILRWQPIAGSIPGALTVRGRGGAIEAIPFDLNHGEIDALGFRIGKLAYTPDVKRIPEASRPSSKGSTSGSSTRSAIAPHPSHFALDEALAEIEAMRPKRAILTNLHTDLDYETLREAPARTRRSGL